MKRPVIDRDSFLQTLEEELQHTSSQGLLTIVAVIDLSRFHLINQIHGCAAGDQILSALFDRLKAIPRQKGYCYRLDGDRFGLILSPVISAQLAPLMARKISGRIAPPFQFEECQIELKFGVGFTSSGGGKPTAEQMLTRAEQAAKIAKTQRSRFHHFDDQVDSELGLQIQLENEITQAMKENSLLLFYQPKIALDSCLPFSAEALLRWQSKFTHISPQKLVDIVENSGQMTELFNWTLNTALRQCIEWPSQHGQQMVAVNMSATCLDILDIADIIESALNLWSVDPARLCLEVTESAVQKDVDQGFSLLNKMHDLGVKISIDDFGTGYSSIEYFKHIPAQELKIDKSFVMNMSQNETDLEIIKLILDWGRRFNMEVVAEGVESKSDLLSLQQLGCDYAQGYHFSPALKQMDFADWLNNYRPENYFD